MSASDGGELRRNRILVGDVRQTLAQLPSSSIDTVITSPPYFRLRNYQQTNQIGLEDQVEGWVSELLVVARGLKRVLKPSGSLWLNLGDTFSRSAAEGALPKSLLLAPERLALRMVDDGWILRNKVIWAKPNSMPTSIKDRLNCTWEVLYFFTPSARYFFDLDAIRIPQRSTGRSPSPTPRKMRRKAWSVPAQWQGPSAGSNRGLDRLKALGLSGHPLGKNPGDVWTISTAGYRGAHHAVFPERLVEQPLLASCPAKVCAACGQPWERERATVTGESTQIGEIHKACTCPTYRTRRGLVLDPFIGSGTTAVVAERLGRDWLGIELNPEFAGLARERIASRGPSAAPTQPDTDWPAA